LHRLAAGISPRLAPLLPLLPFIALVALLVGAVFATWSLARGIELRSFEQHLSDTNTGDLDSSLIAQSFQSPRANLSQVDLQLGSLQPGILPRDGRIRLLAGDGLQGEVVYEAPLTSAEFRDPYLSVIFPPIAASEGLTYTIEVSTPGRSLRETLGIRYNSFDALSSGQMYTDEGAQAGDLALVAFYHYDLAALWRDVGSALSRQRLLVLAWVLSLMLPGLALLVWLPNSLTLGQRLLAAPGVSVLALPVFFLVTRALGLRLGAGAIWTLLAVCAASLALWVIRARPQIGSMRPSFTLPNVVFWLSICAVLFLTLATRLVALRDAVAGRGLDAYHHTLITKMFMENGGIPSSYEPYAPLASFTYHYGFHALAAVVGWLSGQTSADAVMTLMPQVGQVATALPVLTLTLFAWKTLGNRWAGLAAGGLVGLISIFPAFYVNWSRYTQGLGLALLPVAWVLLLEAVEELRITNYELRATGPVANAPTPTSSSWQRAMQQSGPYMLAVIGAAGLALTHYRITMVFASFVALYLLWRFVVAVRARKPPPQVWKPFLRVALVTVITLAALLPWLVNLRQNFGTRFVGKESEVTRGYYSLENMLGRDLLYHPSLVWMLVLSLGGIAWAIRRRDPLPLLPALVWLVMGLWSNPYLLPVRLPYAGYLDATTLASGVWVPLALLAGYTLAAIVGWIISLGEQYDPLKRGVWRAVSAALVGFVALAGGAASGFSLASMIDSKPYISRADAEALAWMRQNLPRDAYVAANPFAFPWDPPPQAVHGSDAGLWVPLLTGGIRASVPPIPAYNERPRDPQYVDSLRSVIQYEPFASQPGNWQGLRAAGVTHIFVGSRGGAFDVRALLASDAVEMLFHRDSVWVFTIR